MGKICILSFEDREGEEGGGGAGGSSLEVKMLVLDFFVNVLSSCCRGSSESCYYNIKVYCIENCEDICNCRVLWSLEIGWLCSRNFLVG